MKSLNCIKTCLLHNFAKANITKPCMSLSEKNNQKRTMDSDNNNNNILTTVRDALLNKIPGGSFWRKRKQDDKSGKEKQLHLTKNPCITAEPIMQMGGSATNGKQAALPKSQGQSATPPTARQQM